MSYQDSFTSAILQKVICLCSDDYIIYLQFQFSGSIDLLISCIVLCVTEKGEPLTVFGTGSPLRQFIFSKVTVIGLYCVLIYSYYNNHFAGSSTPLPMGGQEL